MTSALAERPHAGLIRLGLIGDNIAASRSPDLHRLAGQLAGLDVTYELLIPRQLGRSFAEVFAACRAEGFRGVNVTYPYKEAVLAHVDVDDPLTRRIGSINTVRFAGGRASGHNTDHTGFIAAWRGRFGATPPGRVAIVGAGGVGKAIAFALVALGASRLAVFDTDAAKAARLAEAVAAAGTDAHVAATPAEALRGADGLVHCTPTGMVGYPGTAVPAELLPPLRWAFDAVYTPVETELARAATAAGVKFLSGYELFFHQGVDAFRIFTGRVPDDLGALRRLLHAPD